MAHQDSPKLVSFPMARFGTDEPKRRDKSDDDLKKFMAFTPDYEAQSQFKLFLIGVFLTPITLAGSLIGYVRGYKKYLKAANHPPNLHPLHPLLRKFMIYGAIAAWIIIAIGVLLALIVGFISYKLGPFIVSYLIVNIFFSGVVFSMFQVWRYRIHNRAIEKNRFGSARFAEQNEIAKYQGIHHGIYVGGFCHYQQQGHLLTVAGSRSGKFVNLLAPNLLGMGNIDGSWVVIDPKGEIAAVTSAYQHSIGQNVVILNPWDLLPDHIDEAQTYNPFDILDIASPHLVDDCHMLAEMLVPLETGKNKFFSDSARTIISGLILYIAVTKDGDERTLNTLWKIARYPEEMWDRVIAEMINWQGEDDTIEGDDFVMGDIQPDPNAENIMFAGTEIYKLTQSGSNTWGSILSTVLQATDFLKSPALKKSLQTGFDPKTLAHQNTTVYVIIPADKLQSHSRWLRLVVTSTMRAVIRKPNKRVCFMLDEFAALGYLPEIETAFGTYAGFNVTVWPVLQSLVQLQNLYEKNWEIFIGSAAVRHFFGIHNNFDAEYISKAIGKESHLVEKKSRDKQAEPYANQRDLITPDELRIESGNRIFTFIDNMPPAIFEKAPYFQMNFLNERAGGNPYHSD